MGDEWKAGIMAHFTQFMSAALDDYAAKHTAELAAKDKEIAELKRKAAQDKKDADAQRLKLSFDLQISEAGKAKVEDRVKKMYAELTAVKARNEALEDAAKLHNEQLATLRSENATLEARARQREEEHLEALERESEARDAVNDKNSVLELALTTAEDKTKEAKDKNTVLTIELATEQDAHEDTKAKLGAEVKDAHEQVAVLRENLEETVSLLSQLASERNAHAREKVTLKERISTLERNARSVDRRNVQTRSGLAQRDKHLLMFKAHVGNTHSQHKELRELTAGLVADNSTLRTENSKLVTALNSALEDARRLQALALRPPRTPVQARQAVQQQPDAQVSGGHSSYGLGIFGNVASSTVSAITGSPRSLYKAMMGVAVVGPNDAFTSPV